MRNLSGVALTQILIKDSGTAKACPRMPGLLTLDLSANELDDDALSSIGWACAHGMVALRHLYLWAVDEVTDVGIQSIAQALDCGTVITQAHHVAMARQGRMLDRMPLEIIDLRMCGEVSGSGVIALARVCPWLTHLRLRGLRNIDDATMETVGTSCPRLTALDASGASCTDEGIRSLAAGCPLLEHVQLSGCKRVSNPGVEALAARCAGLRVLDLQGCSTVGTPAARALAEHSRSLHTVSFQCCAGLTDAGFFEVCRRCPLRHITLKLCAVSAEAVKQVEAERPQIRVVCFDSQSHSGRGAATSMTT